MLKPSQRLITSIILFCFAFVFVASAVLAPRPAYAIPTIEGPGPLLTAIVRQPIQMSWWRTIWSSALVGVINSITLFAQQMAYDMAVGLSTGCKGGTPCASWKDFGAAAQASAFDAVGEFIGNLAGPWEGLGLDLCSPRIPDIGISIALGLAEQFQRPRPKCDFLQTIQNWQSVAAEARDPQALLRHLSVNFDPGQTDLGQAFKANEAFRIQHEAKKLADFTERLEGGGILPKKGIISGNIETPAQVMRENFNQLARTGEKTKQPPSASELMSAIGGGDVWLAMGTTVLSTFVNTLASRMLKLAIQGLFSLGAEDERPDLMAPFSGGAGGRRGGVGLSAAASALLTPQIRTSTDAYDFLSELGACPQDRKMATQFNCTIDQQFMVAIQRASTGSSITVAEAADPARGGYLDRARPFGFVNPRGSDTAPPQEPDYREGYPYSSMKKLRLLRIIPIGWELAAQRIDNDDIPATLGDVLNGYRQEGASAGCQGPGASPPDDTESRFCGLVDPNWVLKVPVASCGARVWGALLDSSGLGRQEVCADVRHCVSQNELGTCSAWGYCTREKNIWRFDGDPCPAQYASCDTFRKQTTVPGATVAAAAQVSLLENTLDFGVCNADNAGCTGYTTSQTAAGAWNAASSRLYLDKDAGACTAAADGCREFITSGTANLIHNPGFERDEVAPTGQPDNWTDDLESWGPTEWAVAWSAQSFEGSKAIKLHAADSVKQVNIPLQGSITYTLSMYAKGGDATAPDDQAVAVLAIKDGNGATLSVTDNASSCVSGDVVTSGVGYTALIFTPYSLAGNNATAYIRQSCTLTVPSQARSAELILKKNNSATADVYVDALQLESGTTATNYREGYPSDVQKAYYRVPPDYLGCTGEETPQEASRKGCDRYASLCRREEVGCERYTPSGGGGSPVPGIVTAADRCPSECLGYNTYIKQSSTFEPKFAGENLYLVIPNRSTQCSAQDDGCDEFTNLQTEQREYYSELRACQQPGADSQTYYTWEGSDTAGYQLKTWSFKRSNAGALAGDTITGASPIPPCTNYSVVQDLATGAIGVNCGDTATSQAVCDLNDPGLTLAERADCRAFYDAAGNIFYRLLSRTIISTNECRAYRWTGFPTLPEVTRTPPATRTELERTACDYGHGSWNDTNNQCIYLGVPSQSRACSAQVSGCRGYKGNTGSNINVVFTENFEGTATLADRGWHNVSGTTIVSSSEALIVNERSLRASGSTPVEAYKDLDTPGSSTPTLNPGRTFLISFIAKGSLGSNLRVALKNLPAGGSVQEDAFVGQVSLTPDWRYFQLGPVTVTNIGSETALRTCTGTPGPCSASGAAKCAIPTGATSCTYLDDARLSFALTGTTGSLSYYLDNVSLRQTSDTLYLVKNSWAIPDSCNTLPVELGGGRLRGAMIGCSAYNDRANTAHNLKSFNALCRDGGSGQPAVGCQDLIDTQGLDNPWAQPFNTTNSGTCRGLPIDLNSDGDTSDPGERNCYIGLDIDRDGTIGSSVTRDDEDAVCALSSGQPSCAYGPCAGRWTSSSCVDANGETESGRTTQSACESTPVQCGNVNNFALDDHSVSADVHRYIVVDPSKACQVAQKGCRALGRADGSGGYATAYLKDDPNLYSSTLCKFEEEGCATWQRTDQSLSYFKDPGALGCEWRTNINIGGASYSGWFRKTRQPVANQILVNTREKCSGYGTWNTASKSCVAQGGSTVDFPTALNACDAGQCGPDPSLSPPRGPTTPTCAQCARICNSGAQGTWQPATAPATGGTCVADAPCYGQVEATEAGDAGGSSGNPRIRVDVTPTYLIGGTTFGIRRNGDALYQNRSGDCPQDQATCTEFIDPTDRTQSSRGQAYYFKENARLVEAKNFCNDQVSRKEGCVLFDKTENVRKLWAAEQTYTASDNLANNPGGRVTAQPANWQVCQGSSTVANNGKICATTVTDASTQILTATCLAAGGRCISANDTNIVLRVLRDRDCAEWFQCASAQWVWDPTFGQGGGFKAVCALVLRCDQLNPTMALPGGSLVQCARWNPNPLLTLGPNVSQATCEATGGAWSSRTIAGQIEYYCDLTTGSTGTDNDQIRCEQLGGVWQGRGATPSTTDGSCALGELTDKTYLLRDRRFQGQEYTGYSIPNIYAIDQLREVNVRVGDSTVYRLARPTGRSCSSASPCPGDEVCTSNGCAVAPDGTELSLPDAPPDVMSLSQTQCRGYPETTSPFPGTNEVRASLNYKDAAHCNEPSIPPPAGSLPDTPSQPQPLACECGYVKAEYSGQSLYFRASRAGELPLGCVGGTQNGKICRDTTPAPPATSSTEVTPANCTGGGGECRSPDRQSTGVGWQGYCLERDPSRNINAGQTQYPCLTWWPVDRLSGAPDVYNQFASAGYTPPARARFYCADTIPGWQASLGDGGDDSSADAIFGSSLRRVDSTITVQTLDVRSRNIYKHDIAKIIVNYSHIESQGTSPDNELVTFRSLDQLLPYGKMCGDGISAVPSADGLSLECANGLSPSYLWHGFDTNDGDDNADDPTGEFWWIGTTNNGNMPGVNYNGRTRHPRVLARVISDNRFSGAGIVAPTEDIGIDPIFDGDDEENIHLAVVLHFNSETQQLEDIRFGLNTEQGAWENDCIVARSRGLGNEPDVCPPASVDMDIRLRPTLHCKRVMEIDPRPGAPDSAPYTDRLWQNSNYVVPNISIASTDDPPATRQYTRSLPYSPFGASSSSRSPLRTGDHPWFLDHNLLESSPSVAPSALPVPGSTSPLATIPFSGWPYKGHASWAKYLVQHNVENGSGIVTNSRPTGGSTVSKGVEDLFARSYKQYSWNSSGNPSDANYNPLRGAYQELAGNDVLQWNEILVRAEGVGTGEGAVRVRAVGLGSGGLEETGTLGITVNDVHAPGTIIQGRDGFLPATLKFFAWADKNRMPIKRIDVDWGDGRGYLPGQGLYRNARGAGGCAAAPGFGGWTGDDENPAGACFTGFYQYDYIYTCSGPDSPYWKGVSGSDQCPVADFRDRYSGCCVFNPAVRVQDNWGFCSGNCPDDPAGTDCFGDAECNIPYNPNAAASTDRPWIPFLGRIAVTPRVRQ